MLQNLVFEMQKINVIDSSIVKLALELALEYTLEEELMLCPICDKKLMRYGLKDDKCYCYYCGTSRTGEDIIDEYIKKFCDNSIKKYKCIDCDKLTLIFAEGKYLCLSCNQQHYTKNEIKFCEKCDNPYYYDKETSEKSLLCEECFDKVYDQ